MTWVAWLRPRRRGRDVPVPTRPSPPGAHLGDVGTAGVQRRLEELRETYVERVNCAVAEGRLDLVRQLVDDYTDESLAAMTAVRLDP